MSIYVYRNFLIILFTFHNVNVATRVRCGGLFNITSLHFYCWVRLWKYFINRSTRDKVMGKSRVSRFLLVLGMDSGVYPYLQMAQLSHGQIWGGDEKNTRIRT